VAALDLGPQLAAFLHQYPFASARVFAQHSLTSVPTITEILQGELGLENFSRRWVPHFLPPPKNLLVDFHRRIPQATFGYIWTIHGTTIETNGIKIREPSCFMITALTKFARHKRL
jgi:hypothetical protein